MSLRQPRFKLVHFVFIFYLIRAHVVLLYISRTFQTSRWYFFSHLFLSFFTFCFLFLWLSLSIFTVLLMWKYTWHCTQSLRAKWTMKINFKTTKTFITKLFIHFFFSFEPSLGGLYVVHLRGQLKKVHDCICYFFILPGRIIQWNNLS